MLNGAKRRMAVLERSIQLPVTVDRFLARVNERARLTGASFDDALGSLVVSLGDQELAYLVEELERQGYCRSTSDEDDQQATSKA